MLWKATANASSRTRTRSCRPAGLASPRASRTCGQGRGRGRVGVGRSLRALGTASQRGCKRSAGASAGCHIFPHAQKLAPDKAPLLQPPPTPPSRAMLPAPCRAPLAPSAAAQSGASAAPCAPPPGREALRSRSRPGPPPWGSPALAGPSPPPPLPRRPGARRRPPPPRPQPPPRRTQSAGRAGPAREGGWGWCV